MPYLNRHTIIGHLGQDPEVKFTPAGKAYAHVSIATTEKWKDKDGNKKEKTSWHRAVLWGAGAEFAGEYCKKGDLVYVSAPSHTREWEDKDGMKRYTTEVTCTRYEHFMLLKKKDEERKQPDKNESTSSQSETDYDDDIPF